MARKINTTNWFLILLSTLSIGSALYFYNENVKLERKIAAFLNAAKSIEAENKELRTFALEQKEKIDFLENINVADSINKNVKEENNLPATPEEEISLEQELQNFKDLNKRRP